MLIRRPKNNFPHKFIGKVQSDQIATVLGMATLNLLVMGQLDMQTINNNCWRMK